MPTRHTIVISQYKNRLIFVQPFVYNAATSGRCLGNDIEPRSFHLVEVMLAAGVFAAHRSIMHRDCVKSFATQLSLGINCLTSRLLLERKTSGLKINVLLFRELQQPNATNQALVAHHS
jgi:hypothetical protein